MRTTSHALLERLLALLLALLVGTYGCSVQPGQDPSPGVPEYQQAALIPVPGGFVNAAGGNLILERTDLSIDTILGTQEIRAVYNAASGDWLWSFQVHYDGSTWLDATGAAYDVSGIAGGEAVPGTVWVVVDGDTIRTKGGRAYHFDASGRLAYEAWATASYPRIQYTWTASSVELASCAVAAVCLPFYAIDLDAEGNPTLVTDLRTGRTADFQYDALGRLTVARDPQAVEQGWPGWRYEYGLAGTLLEAATSSEGERVEYAYQASRRISKITQIGEGNPIHGFAFYAKGGTYHTVHGNPLGGLTRYVVDSERRLLETVLGNGERTVLTWQGLRPASVTTPAGVTTQLTYVDDDLETIVEPSGNVVTFSYEPGGLNFEDPARSAIATVSDTIGLLEQRTYDALGRLSAVSNGEGDLTTFTYNPGWAVDSSTLPTGTTLTFPFYGVHGHWLDMNANGADANQRQFSLVGDALVPNLARNEGGFLTRAYDGTRYLSSIDVAATDEAANVVATGSVVISRRSDGQITYIARPGGGDHEFVYDALGRPVELRELVDGAWHVTLIEYDAAGNETARERPNGMREEFEYDAHGRMTRHRTLRDGSLEGEATFSYSEGRLTQRYDSVRDQTETYTHDAAGRLQTTQYSIYGETATRRYDLRSRLTGETLATPVSGVVLDVTYEYDLANRRIGMVDELTGTQLVDLSFADGVPEATEYGNGLVRHYVFDDLGKPTAATTVNSLSQVVESTTIEYTGELGPPREQTRTTTATTLATTDEEYWFAPGASFAVPEQLVGKRLFGWNDGGGGSKTFAWDELSNRAGNSAGDSFTYNPEGNRLLSASLAHEGETVTYTYDEAGFVTSRNGVAITWTAAGRLASHGSTTLEWDAAGRLLSSSVDGVTREFLLFGGRVEGDLVSLGAVDLGEVVLQLGSGETTYRHFDFRGNVSFVSDDTGSVVAHYQYSPYGLDAAFGPEAGETAFEARPGLGPFVLMGARMFDPLVDRFLQPDPMIQPTSQYAYTLGNPIHFEDRDGREMSGRTKAAIAGAALGVAVAAVFAVAVLPATAALAAGAGLTTAQVTTAAAAAAGLVAAAIGFALTAPGSPPPPSPSPSPPAPDPGESGDGKQIKKLVLTIDEADTSCSPAVLARTPGIDGALPYLLLINLLLGVVWWWRRRAGVNRCA